MNLRPFSNYVEFSTPIMFSDKARVNGSQIIIDVGFEPHKHVITHGIVTKLPVRLGNQPMPLQRHVGLPEYFEHAPVQFKLVSDIEPELELGDKIYFHFNTISSRSMVVDAREAEDGLFRFAVRYDNIICAVRDGKIIPIGSYTLVTPDMELWQDILIPTFYDIKDKEGKPMPKPESMWLQKKVAPEAKYLLGYVAHIGTPLKNDKKECEVGQKIIYKKNSDWTNKIEGEDFYCIRQCHIEGRFIEN